MEKGKITSFLKAKAKLYFIDAMGAMALGLFASLLICTIFNALGMIPGLDFLKTIGACGSAVSGPAMAVAIAVALKASPLVVYTCAAVGYLANTNGGAGGPLAVLFITIIAAEIGMLVSKKTKVDILVTPFVTLFVGGVLSVFCAPYIGKLVGFISKFIGFATEQEPLIMGIIVSVVVGMALTLPISSAAICAMIGITGIAGGAAVAGCCAQMVGFAVISFRENKWGGVVAQGLGTSMLQMGNIVKNPLIWIPATLASAITGPISTCIFKLECTGVSAGMGTCGLVGPLGVFTKMGFNANSIIGVILVCVVLPAVLSLVFSEIMRKLGWIKENDLKLDL